MGTPVDDVHHRHRHAHRTGTAEVAIERQAGLFGRRLGNGHRDREHGVGAKARLVVGAVQFAQGLVNEGLLFGVEADDGLGNFGIDVLDGAGHTLAEEAR